MFNVLVLLFKQLSKMFFFCPNFAQMTSTWVKHKDAALLKTLLALCEKSEGIAVVYKPSVGLIIVYIKNNKMLRNRQSHNTRVPVVLAKPYAVHWSRILSGMNHLLGRTLKTWTRNNKLKNSIHKSKQMLCWLLCQSNRHLKWVVFWTAFCNTANGWHYRSPPLSLWKRHLDSEFKR